MEPCASHIPADAFGVHSWQTGTATGISACHPCRWKYHVVEEMRPGEFYPLDEDSRGTYIFNSRDIRMIEHIPEMIKAGIDSLKIEGRMKGINYLAPVVKTYREAIDRYYENPSLSGINDNWAKDLKA